MTTESGVETLFAETEKRLGPPDIIVPNATCDQPHRPIEEYDWAFYQSMLDFFVKSPYLLARRAAPHETAEMGPHHQHHQRSFPAPVAPFSAYVAAKGAQIGWSRSMSRELAPFGITVNMVAPGWILVERHEKDSQAEKDGYFAQIPMRSLGHSR